MPSAYTVVWCNHAGNRHVLLATKNFLGTRFGGAPSPATLLNGAGQACFPGGDVHNGETDAQAGQREFLEETGIDMLAPINVANYNVVHNIAITAAPAHPFATFYIQVAALADLNQLAIDVNNNIAANIPVDEELQGVQVVAEAAVVGQLGPNALIPPGGWHAPRMAQLAATFRVRGAIPPAGVAWHQVAAAGVYVPPHQRPYQLNLQPLVTAKLNSPHNWHAISVANLAAAAAAAALAAAALLAAAVGPVGPVPVLAPIGPPVHVGAPLHVAPPGNIAGARRTVFILASLVAVGLAVTAKYWIPYFYPTDS